MSAPITRAALLAGGIAAAAGALAGCGAQGVRLAPSPPGDLGDAAIGRVLAGAALLLGDFYARAAVVPGFAPDQAARLQAAEADERAHHAALAAAFGPGVPLRLRFSFPSGTFATPDRATATGVALQRSATGSFLGAVSELGSPGLGTLAARIAANGAQHLQMLMFLGSPVPGSSASIPDVLTSREAARAVAPYLA